MSEIGRGARFASVRHFPDVEDRVGEDARAAWNLAGVWVGLRLAGFVPPSPGLYFLCP